MSFLYYDIDEERSLKGAITAIIIVPTTNASIIIVNGLSKAVKPSENCFKFSDLKIEPPIDFRLSLSINNCRLIKKSSTKSLTIVMMSVVIISKTVFVFLFLRASFLEVVLFLKNLVNYPIPTVIEA